MTPRSTAMPTRRRTLVAAALALAITGCGGKANSTAHGHAATFNLRDDPSAGIAPVDPTRGAVLPAADLHALLDSLLSEHSALAVHLMRATADGSATDRVAVTKALAANTESLTGAIGIVYGPEGARAFDQLWKQHIQFFADYAAATSATKRAKALADLHDYNMDFSSFTATATGGRAPLEAVVGLLHTHIAQLTAQSDAYRKRDYVAAVAHQHEARMHMYEISAALAGAISGQQPAVFPGDAGSNDTALATIQARTEAVQLRLDRAWSAAYRPGLVPSINSAIARLEAPIAGESVAVALALSSGEDPTTVVTSCADDITKGVLDDAMRCGHRALAAAAVS